MCVPPSPVPGRTQSAPTLRCVAWPLAAEQFHVCHIPLGPILETGCSEAEVLEALRVAHAQLFSAAVINTDQVGAPFRTPVRPLVPYSSTLTRRIATQLHRLLGHVVRSHRAQEAAAASVDDAWATPTQSYPGESTHEGHSAGGGREPEGGQEEGRDLRSGSWGSDTDGHDAQERAQKDKAYTWHGAGRQSGEMEAQALLHRAKAATSTLVLRDGEGEEASFVSEGPSVDHEAAAGEERMPGEGQVIGEKGEESAAAWGSLGARSCTVSVGHLLPGKALTPSLVRGVGKSGAGLPPPRFRGTGTSGGWAGAERWGRTTDSISTQESGSNRQSGNGVGGRAELSPSPLHVDTGEDAGQWSGAAAEGRGDGGASPLHSEAEAPSPLSTSSAKRAGSTGTSTPSGASEFIPSPISTPPSPTPGEEASSGAPRTEKAGSAAVGDGGADAKREGRGPQEGDGNGRWRYGDDGAVQSPGSSPEERSPPGGGGKRRRRRGSALAAGGSSLWREDGKEESPLSAALLRELDESPAQ